MIETRISIIKKYYSEAVGFISGETTPAIVDIVSKVE